MSAGEQVLHELVRESLRPWGVPVSRLSPCYDGSPVKRLFLLFALVGGFLTGLPVLAAQLSVTVTDRDGGALPDVAVYIELVATEGQSGRTAWFRVSRATSDGAGKARFSGLAPGSWAEVLINTSSTCRMAGGGFRSPRRACLRNRSS